jgi:UDP-N-acetylglucosamine 2-epimerase (non-hydrolysing)
LVGNSPKKIRQYAHEILEGRYKKGGVIPLWDGRTAGRIVSVLKEYFGLSVKND